MSTSAEATGNGVSPEDLSKIALFEHLEPEALSLLAADFTAVEVEDHQVVFEEGGSSEAFFVVRSGALAVYRDAVGQPVRLLTRLHPGDFFGELGLLGNGRHGASVRASEPTVLLRLGKGGFTRFLERHPEIQLRLQLAAASRHSQNVATALELGRRREVRIRCRQDVPLEIDGGERRTVTLENLSLGGLCMTGAPESWKAGDEVGFGLGLREGVLSLKGRVCWKRDASVGIAFVDKSANHDMIIQMAIRLMLESSL
ncbi:MAG: cyclic nucleotide-binding domain-containing protein [Acidobacteriota bacterium]